MSRKAAGILLLGMTVLWGLSFPLTQMAIGAGLGPNMIVLLRGLIYLLCCVLFFGKTIAKITGKEFLIGLVAGLFSFGGFILQTLGLRYTTSSNAAFLTAMSVVIVPFVTWLFYKERPKKQSIISVPLCVLGLAVLTNVFAAGASLNIGDLLSLLCAFSFAVMIAYLSHTASGVDFRKTAFVFALVQSAGAAVAVAAAGDYHMAGVDWAAALPLLLYLGIGASFVTSVSQIKAQQSLSPTTAALIMACESIFGSVFSIMLGLEAFTWTLLVGGALVFAAVVVMETGKPKSTL